MDSDFSVLLKYYLFAPANISTRTGGREGGIVRCTETINIKGERIIAVLFQPVFSQTVPRKVVIRKGLKPVDCREELSCGELLLDRDSSLLQRLICSLFDDTAA